MSEEHDNESEFQSILGIRMPDELRGRIQTAAGIEHRTESSFARFHLSKAADTVIAENKPKRK